YDVFGSIGSGAALVLIADQRDIVDVCQTVEEKGITIWNSVPAIMDLLIENILGEEDNNEEPMFYWSNAHMQGQTVRKITNSSLRVVLLSGDWIPVKLPNKLNKHFVNAEVISLGGATEASIWSIYYPIDDIEENKSIPYGMPLANQKFYVLNYELEHCPVGVQGELYIGGIGLAEEYLNDKEKTKAAFVIHPDLGRLYCTGDYGVLHQEGHIEFLGRKDQQVKIRGYRVEIGEIENQLLNMHDVKEVVVLDKLDNKGKKFLCAYIVSETEINVINIKEKLAMVLPDYMVPLHFIQIKEMPLTPNGKINRKDLPSPDMDVVASTSFVAPETELENLLDGIWRGILGVEKIGVNDNLFEYGVDSTSIIKFVSRLSTDYNIQIPIHQVFKTPNVREIAKAISNLMINPVDVSSERMLLNANNLQEKNIFCFPPVVALGVVYQRLSEILDRYAFYSFNFIESEDRIEKYIELIKEIQPEGPYTFLGISAGGNLAFEITKVMEQRGDKIEDIILMDSFYIQDINPNRLTDEESRKYASETVELMLKQYPQLQSEGEFFRNHVGEKIRGYYTYLDRLINSGQVNANLHVIKSPSSQSKHVRGDINLWQYSTTGKYTICNGYGDHEKMLDGKYVEQNAILIEKSLS
ncbi:AMP-binding protein, partial [Bacillus toyonensis]|uniref:non-ribosomal peptide synthetase n=1 Tax=Bacillus toyonensis TaxID=155322 RepID=UPI001F114B44